MTTIEIEFLPLGELDGAIVRTIDTADGRIVAAGTGGQSRPIVWEKTSDSWSAPTVLAEAGWPGDVHVGPDSITLAGHVTDPSSSSERGIERPAIWTRALDSTTWDTTRLPTANGPKGHAATASPTIIAGTVGDAAAVWERHTDGWRCTLLPPAGQDFRASGLVEIDGMTIVCGTQMRASSPTPVSAIWLREGDSDWELRQHGFPAWNLPLYDIHELDSGRIVVAAANDPYTLWSSDLQTWNACTVEIPTVPGYTPPTSCSPYTASRKANGPYSSATSCSTDLTTNATSRPSGSPQTARTRPAVPGSTSPSQA